MLAELDLAIAGNFATALLIGALLGIEREKRNAREGGGIAGLRSFILLAMLGAIAGHLATAAAFPWILPAVIVVAGALVITGYVVHAKERPDQIGLTSELAAVVACLLGALVTTGHREIAVGLGVATAALLVYKQPLHHLVGRLAVDDVHVGTRLLLATFIVLPLLPDHTIDPWGAINPHKLWILVLLISSLSLVGYVATRWLGAGRGIAITAVAGGLASSTAVTLALCKQSREEGAEPAQLTGGILIAWAIMCVRVLVVAAVIAPAVLAGLSIPFAAMLAACSAVAWWSMRAGGAKNAAIELQVKNPFSLLAAMRFAALFAAVQLLLKLAQEYVPHAGVHAIAAVAGLTDVDAITVAMAERAREQAADVHLAVVAITVASLSNTVVKAIMAATLGRGLAHRVGVGAAAMIAAGVLGLVLA